MQDNNDLFEDFGLDIETTEQMEEKITDGELESGETIARYKNEPYRLYREPQQLTQEDRELAVNMLIIPPQLKNASFNEEHIKQNIQEQKKLKHARDPLQLDQYLFICNTLLNTFRVGDVTKQSYIIGAPNGFGKSSFVIESLITLLKCGHLTVPYISLRELQEIRAVWSDRSSASFRGTAQRNNGDYRYPENRTVEHLLSLKDDLYDEIAKVNKKVARAKKLLDKALNEDDKATVEKAESDLKNAKKLKSEYNMQCTTLNANIERLKIDTKMGFTYQNYIDADCVFVMMSSLALKEDESYMLLDLLLERGAKAKPTIVTVPWSLDPYKNSPELMDRVWGEIIYKDNIEKQSDLEDIVNSGVEVYDRLIHVRTYRQGRLKI